MYPFTVSYDGIKTNFTSYSEAKEFFRERCKEIHWRITPAVQTVILYETKEVHRYNG